MISDSTHFVLDGDEFQPDDLGEQVVSQIRPLYGTEDYSILNLMRWMYRAEAEAAEFGSGVEFEFDVWTGQQSYRVGFQSSLSAEPEKHILAVKAITFQGLVLEDREHNGYHDSDFYAVVWDEPGQRTRRIEYASTRYASSGYCTVDATPEVRSKAAKVIAAWNREQQIRRAWEEAATVQRGKFVRVVKDYNPRGDNLPAQVGDHGYVFWTGESRFGMRAGIEFVGGEKDGQKTFLPVEKLEVMNPADYVSGIEG